MATSQNNSTDEHRSVQQIVELALRLSPNADGAADAAQIVKNRAPELTGWLLALLPEGPQRDAALRILPTPELDSTTAAKLILTGADYQQQLLDTAQTLDRLGISYSPCVGEQAADYRGAKRPALQKCGVYQYERQPSQQELRSWFDAGIVGGWGVWCGNVSRLICVDTDTTDAETAFCLEFGTLPATYTEHTPGGGRHRWYRLPPDTDAPLTVQVHEFGELRGDGAFAVIAPTRWRDHEWTVYTGTLDTIYTLKLAELDDLLNFYTRHAPQHTTTPRQPHEPTGQPVTELDDLAAEIERRLDAHRFNARGFSEPLLCPFHDDEHPSAAWNRDNRTLHCFVCSPQRGRDFLAVEVARQIGIPLAGNTTPPVIHTSTVKAIRAHHKGRAGDTLTRVVVALLLQGIEPDTHFAAAAAIEKCAGIVGRDGVRSSLKNDLFRVVDRLPGELEDVSEDTHTNRTMGDMPTTRNKSTVKYRPAKMYRMPTERELCERYDVEPAGRLPLTLDDLRTGRSMTDLLIEKDIERRPGQQSYAQIGDELGSSGGTARRHITDNLKITRTPTYSRVVTIIDAQQVAALATNTARRKWNDGRFLEWHDQRGVHHCAPTVRAAQWLLENGFKVTFYERGANAVSKDETVTDADADAYRQARKLYRRLVDITRDLLDDDKDRLREQGRGARDLINLAALNRLIARARVLRDGPKNDETTPLAELDDLAGAVGATGWRKHESEPDKPTLRRGVRSVTRPPTNEPLEQVEQLSFDLPSRGVYQ